SDDNEVGAISQIMANNKDAAFNGVTITQDIGDDNRVGTIYQRRGDSAANVATLTQSGARNTINRIYQNNGESGSTGANNHVTITLIGDDNGSGALTLAALQSLAVSSNVVQSGTRHRTTLTITGSSNEFGINQSSGRGSVVNAQIGGDGNQFGVNQ